MPDRPTPSGRRWRSHTLAATVLRVLIFLVPLAVGFAAGAGVGKLLPDPSAPADVLVWWVAVIGAATIAATVTDRLARRLLPLTVLMRMTMLFPDRAPSRLQVARRAGKLSELRRRVEAAQHGGDTDMAEMAEMILSLAAALSQHDRKTRGHSERTRAYTDMLAEEMGLSELDRDKLRWAALLHDVGKLEVPAEVLNKDAKLTDEEWQLIRQHPLHGMRLVGPLVPWLGTWAKTIEHHHERWDGSGYPHGLAGTNISLGARIVSVADAYDVMTSGRSYQKAKTPAAARQEIAVHAGKQFDPTVVRALINVSLGRLRWATGPLATLAEIPFLRGLPQVGRDLATVLTSSALMATSLVVGTVPAPTDITPSELARIVIAGAAAGQQEAVEPTTPGESGSDPDGTITASADPTTTTAPTTTTPTSTSTSTSTTTARTPTSTTRAPSTTAPPATTTTSIPTATTTASTTTTSTTTTTTAPAGSVTAAADSAATSSGGTVLIRVLANDEGPADQKTVSVVSSPSSGGVADVGQSGHVKYTAPGGFTGTDTFSYSVCNSDGSSCSTATVTVTVG